MFATKLKVASALFLFSFIIWLVLILLLAYPADNVGRIQFSNLSLLALFLGSAIAASFSSMAIGLDLLELKMKPTSLAKFGRGRFNLQVTKSAATSLKQQKKDSEDDETALTKITVDKKPIKRNNDERKAFFLFGETEFIGCKFERGYLKDRLKDALIPDECFGCPYLLECCKGGS